MSQLLWILRWYSGRGGSFAALRMTGRPPRPVADAGGLPVPQRSENARVVRARGVFRAPQGGIGRPQTMLDDIPANFLRHYPAYKNGAFNLSELSRLCGISRTTAYKYIGLLEQ